jgi:hypothetical protein
MPSPFSNTAAGAPRYRRPVSWALAAREVTIPPQRHAGRVKDGPFSQIVVDPTKDPQDGFIYHDERLTPGLTGARFHCVRTRIGLPGVFCDQPNLMSPPGSQFTLLPLGNVMDLACDLTYRQAQLVIDSDVRLNPNGTIFENDARAIEKDIGATLNAAMVATFMVSSATVTVDRANNVQLTGTINLTVAIQPRGYVLTVNETIGFVLPNQGG